MKLWLLAVLAIGLASAIPPKRKQADAEFVDKQKKVLEVFIGLGVDDDKHEYKDFEFEDAKFYTKPDYAKDFMKAYHQGFLDRDGVFTLHCSRTRRDTFLLFDILFFAKDFNTFHQIALWAKSQLHPVQFAFAFSLAVSHRPDCKGIMMPRLYEIFPSYFVPEMVMTKAKHAKLHDVKYRKFEFNNTGWEWSWHKDMTSGIFKSSNKWNGNDREVWMSYFREDADFNNWYAYNMIFFMPFLNPEKYDIHFERRGEYLYNWFKWMLNRYNLERLGNKLPPVEAFDFESPLIGYNSHLSDNLGRSLNARPSSMIPANANHEFQKLFFQAGRYFDAISAGKMHNFDNDTNVDLETHNGIEYLGRAIYGSKNIFNHKFYGPLFFSLVNYVDNMVSSPNDRELTYGAMGSVITSVRDPAFWQVLAKFDNMFTDFLDTLHPYTHEELLFDTVELKKFEIDRLVTYFERNEFELTNGVPFHDRKDRAEKKYEASQFRINHKPFTYKVHVHSKKATDAMIRVMIGPKYDSERRPLSLDQARHMFYPADHFYVKLNEGDNVIDRNPQEIGWYTKPRHFRELYQEVKTAAEKNQPFFYDEVSSNCGFPYNLAIPKGSESGRDYQLFIIVSHFDYKYSIKNGICGHQKYFDQHSGYFPMDRPIPFEVSFKVPNAIFQDVKIYHVMDDELNRT